MTSAVRLGLRACLTATLLGCLVGCGAREAIVVPMQSFTLVEASSLVSFELWVLDQVGRDDTPVACDDLLARRVLPRSDNVVALADPVAGDFSTAAKLQVGNIRSGERNVIVYVDVFDQPGQLGERAAVGCVQAVSVKGGQTFRVELEIDAPPIP